MEGQLSPETMKLVRTGQRPEDRAVRKQIKNVYEGCLASSGGEKTFAAYDGPLFDAMSQIDDTVNMDKAMEAVRAVGMSKLGLFARSRKELHQNERAVLALAQKNSDLIVLDAPKYFQLFGDVAEKIAYRNVEKMYGVSLAEK
ncbi:MAG: hypothetical protein JEY79_14515 [Pseudodesulfovibrio sp.]|nr:hypothetical protein [Pseudodesulfovibrio sp.]